MSVARIRIYRVSLNSHYRLWRLVVGTKMVNFCIRTHVWKHTASPLQTKYHHMTWTLPLLLLIVHFFSSVSTYKMGSMWHPAISAHTQCLCTTFWYTRSPILGNPTSSAVDVHIWCSACGHLFIILCLKLSCNSLEVCCCWTWLTTHLGNMLIWCYCIAGAGYGFSGCWTIRYCWSCVPEHGI